MLTLLVAASVVLGADLPAWNFDDPAELQAWQANAHLQNATVADGVLKADAVDWDPFFTCKDFEFPATPWQCVVIRMKADKSGMGQLFWSGATEGQYGGIHPDKTTPFDVIGDNKWHDVVIYPFWHPEKVIKQFRLDVYDGAHFEIDSIAVKAWGEGREPDASTYQWHFKGVAAPWPPATGREEFSWPLALDVTDKGWVNVALGSDKDAVATLLYASRDKAGLIEHDFAIKAGDTRYYNLEMSGVSGWDNLVALGLRRPANATAVVDSIAISDDPAGPPQIEVAYFGFENGANRAGRESTVIAQLRNHGGVPGVNLKLELKTPEGIEAQQSVVDVPPVEYDLPTFATWRVTADKPGTYPVELVMQGEGAAETQRAELTFMPAKEIVKADYVPEPKPIQTTADVCAYYFPGWETDAKWDCIRQIAPVRKPLLGYYDESNPECVDWQIKWAVENGISCFLVDWYWVAGRQHLTHWFEAYRKARYRDQLKVAIMWANHNPEGSHSFEDWHNVTREWIDKYFNLPGYYRIDGKPAVFLWDPNLIRHDLGGSEGVIKAFNESQEMAKAAGYEGITFVSMHRPSSEKQVETMQQEGYFGATSYHEWGTAGDLAPDAKHWRYEDLVKTAPEAWRKNRDLAGDRLTYYAVADTGWDARPWHGDKMQVLYGRTPQLFEQLLRSAKEFVGSEGRPIVIVSPVNEWGEGSYIEPATEYDFGMYEAVRNVFGVGDPASWPENLSPADIGRGPYDYPPRELATSWTFDNKSSGWRFMMGTSEPAVENGAFTFNTTSKDPAILVETPTLRASRFTGMEIRMQLIGTVPPNNNGQLFWSRDGARASEATSIAIPLQTDGQMHTYTLNLKDHARWRGHITSLRLDPCSLEGIKVIIEEIILR